MDDGGGALQLPSGVTERDVALFTKSQGKAKRFLEKEQNASLTQDISTHKTGGPEHGVPSQVKRYVYLFIIDNSCEYCGAQ